MVHAIFGNCKVHGFCAYVAHTLGHAVRNANFLRKALASRRFTSGLAHFFVLSINEKVVQAAQILTRLLANFIEGKKQYSNKESPN